MPKRYNASIPLDIHKEAMRLISFRQLLLRVKAYEVTFDLRYIQAEELEKQISKVLETKHDNRRSAILNFTHFTSWRNTEIRWEHVPISKAVFIQQKNNLHRIIEQLSRWNFFIDDKLQIIESLLSRNHLLDDWYYIWSEIENIDYEEILCSKRQIIIDRKEYEKDSEYLLLLDSLYLFYTQYWRIMETLGDFYNDIQVLKEKRDNKDDIDSFFEWLIQFSHSNPLNYIIIWGKNISFSVLEHLTDKQSIILLYTILTSPWESIDAIRTYYEVNKTKFWLRHWNVSRETLEKQYVSRLNIFLKKSWLELTCKRDFIGLYIE